MVDFKSMTSPNAALAVLIATDEATRARMLEGLAGLGASAVQELDGALARIAARAGGVTGGDRVARRILTVRQQVRRTRGGQGLGSLGSWFSEILGSAKDIIGGVIGGATGGGSGGGTTVVVPTLTPPPTQPDYSQSWYARNDPTSGAAQIANSNSGLMDFGILAILSKMLGSEAAPQVQIAPSPFNPYAIAPVSAPTGPTTILGMKPEIAALVALGAVFMLTRR